MTSPRHCTAPGCGKLLVKRNLSNEAWERRLYCDRACRAVVERAAWIRASRVCKGCGEVFHRKPDQELCDFRRRPYCSGECYQTSRATRAQRKKPPGRVAFVANGNVALNNAMRARRIARAPKGRFETIEEAEARGIIISRIVLTNAYALSPPGMPVGSKIGFRTGKVGR